MEGLEGHSGHGADSPFPREDREFHSIVEEKELSLAEMSESGATILTPSDIWTMVGQGIRRKMRISTFAVNVEAT